MSTRGQFLRALASTIVALAFLIAVVPTLELNPQPLPPGGDDALSVLIGL